jgi:ubiquinone/menaquinone biosynthesis C-methylase UbiE
MSLETIDFNRLNIRPGDRLLDLGCGEGRHSISAYLLADAEIVGLDLGLKDLKTAKGRLMDFPTPPSKGGYCAFIQGSGHELPFSDNAFDHVICSEVLEHIPDYPSFLREINRVLKPGGLFAVSVPRYFPEWVCWQLSDAYHQVEGGHVRIFQASHLRQRIQSIGFKFLSRHWAHSLHVPYWWLKCLFWNRSEEHFLVTQYHRLLVWDLMQRPWLTQFLDRLLNPFLGKSVVMYFRQP